MRRAVGVLLGTILVLLVIEGAVSYLGVAASLVLRPAPVLAERLHTRFDPEVGWVGRPNLSLADFYAPGADLHTDSRGFRGTSELSREVPEGRVRVVCSGDSFALGYGVDDGSTWCARLEALDPRLETANLGQGGYGIDQSWLWWRRATAELEHHVHLFTFIVEDFVRMESDTFFGYGKPKLALQRDTLVVQNVPVPRAAYRWPWLTRNAARASELRSVALLGRWLGRGSSQPVSGRMDESPALAFAVFEALSRAHAEAGRQLVLVYLPMRSEFEGRDTDAFRAFLADEAARRGLVFLDLTEDLRRLQPERVESLFIGPDEVDFAAAAGHYSEAGNRRVAEWIYARVGGSFSRVLRE